MFEKEILEEKSCRESWECVNVNIISKIIGETLWSTQQHEFEYQAAHAKYRAEQQSMIFSLINTICPSQTYSGVKHEFEQSPFSFVVSIFNTL